MSITIKVSDKWDNDTNTSDGFDQLLGPTLDPVSPPPEADRLTRCTGSDAGTDDTVHFSGESDKVWCPALDPVWLPVMDNSKRWTDSEEGDDDPTYSGGSNQGFL
eukprot:jgi/Undpi1/4552/HiC_scaffold_18.g07906.m1